MYLINLKNQIQNSLSNYLHDDKVVKVKTKKKYYIINSFLEFKLSCKPKEN